ncbi:glutaredoxin family protein [Ureibacillus chungkukjangi]|uniref:Glutaredoxin 3 n=1 Tax=Ureibacillus chungkukjangi TaxID=1202712 RepID=A0A318TPB3_9BACL|nr:glutaredoxin [Ureibacillus chungkukjangi]MCM3388783.1 glutaredoxin [Ureibacillus chungkukjangi]PYF06692.1 glutaredoxin 3 [Ureibacillus chungkukjangi]
MKLYTKTVCPKCMWVKSELEKAKVIVEEVNIDHEPHEKEFLIQSGLLTVPVLEIEGRLIGDVKEIISQIELVAQ